jgi:hypothetical protein
MEQSLDFVQSVSECPMANECRSQMNQGNNLLSPCRNVTARANQLDQHNFKLNYNNIPTSWLNNTYKAYAVIRQLAYPYVTENIFPPNPIQNQVEININLNANSTAYNVSIEAPLMNVNFTDVRLSPLAASIIQINPENSVLDRIGELASPLYSERKSNFVILVYYLC